MVEVVGAVINGGTVTNDRAAIYQAVHDGRVNKWLDRRHMQFMAACDLGPNWQKLADSPTLFKLDDNGKPFAP